MATSLVGAVSTVANITLAETAYPLHWVVKNGCLDNSTILKPGTILYWDDDRKCELQQGNLFPGKYAWGMCSQSGIRLGYGNTYDECVASMQGTEGYHQHVVTPHEIVEGYCYCLPDVLQNIYTSYTCVKETTTTTTTTTSTAPPLAYKAAQSSKQHHEYHPDNNAPWIVLSVFLVITVIAIGVFYLS